MTDLSLHHDWPDITYDLKDKQEIIDIAVPGDCRIEQKSVEKREKYVDFSGWQVLEVSHFCCPYYCWNTGFYPKGPCF